MKFIFKFLNVIKIFILLIESNMDIYIMKLLLQIQIQMMEIINVYMIINKIKMIF